MPKLPLTPATRRDLENQAYEAWRVAVDKEPPEMALRQLLKGHAEAVEFSILRRSEPELVIEAVDKVMMNLGTYDPGRGVLFTTWVHAIMTRVMYDQRRLDRKRKEVSVDTPGFDLPGEPSIGISDVLLTVKNLLSPSELLLFEQISIKGMSHMEAAKELNIPSGSIRPRWHRVLRKLKDGFTKSVPHRGRS